jgi:hypothetical protein
VKGLPHPPGARTLQRVSFMCGKNMAPLSKTSSGILL